MTSSLLPLTFLFFAWMPKGKIASLLEIEGDEVIHSILDVMYADAPYTVIERAMHVHPTVTALMPTCSVS
jgi:hypothetical protein